MRTHSFRGMSWLTQTKLSSMLEEALRSEKSYWRPLRVSGDVDFDSRSIEQTYETSLRWILEVSYKLRCYPECFCLTVTLLNKFLRCIKVQQRHVTCAAAACLIVAIKVTEEDSDVPRLGCIADAVLKVSGGTSKLTVGELMRMEAVVLDKLSWNVNLVTPLQFLHILHAMVTHKAVPKESWPTDVSPQEAVRLLSSTVPRNSHGMRSPSRQLSTASAKLMKFICIPSAASLAPSVIALCVLILELAAGYPSQWTFMQSLLGPPCSCWPASAETAWQLLDAVGASAEEFQRGSTLVATAIYRCPAVVVKRGTLTGGICDASKLCKQKCERRTDFSSAVEGSATDTRDSVTIPLRSLEE